MEREVSKPGLQALRALKKSLDPDALMNPGKLLPAEGDAHAGWAQATTPVAETTKPR